MFADSFRRIATSNHNFRQVLHTGRYSQVVAMSLPPGADIGAEVHPDTDQLFIIAAGHGEVTIGATSRPVTADDIVVVPAGNRHNVSNNGDGELQLLTIYAPPAHAPGTVLASKPAG